MLLYNRPKQPQPCCREESKRNIAGIDGVANEEDYNQYGDPLREDDDDDEPYVKRRSKTKLPKKNHNPWKRKSHDEGLNYSAPNKKGKKITTKKRRRH